MNHHDTIQRYYRAFRDRDRDTLERILAPEFHFASSFGEFHGRDAMLDAIWPSVGQTWATNLRIFGEWPEFVVLYQHANTPGMERPPMTMAEHVRFDGDRIAAIEVYLGRPLQSGTQAETHGHDARDAPAP